MAGPLWACRVGWAIVDSGRARHAGGDGRLGAEAMRRLRARDVCAIEAGLTETELAQVEDKFGFSDDHRAFLTAGLPVNTRPQPREPGVFYTHDQPWPDWRNSDPATLRVFLDWPAEGVLLDVEHNGFWYHPWGPHPEQLSSALETARGMLAEVPVMVPVYGHRYLPAGAGTARHPVLSMWQTDIIYYGLDLADYIDREFGNRRPIRGQRSVEPASDRRVLAGSPLIATEPCDQRSRNRTRSAHLPRFGRYGP